MLVRFDAQVIIPLAEIKLIETSKPLILVGSDLMVPPAVQKGWPFRDMGYDKNDMGTICFHKQTRTRPVQLLAWPTLRPEMSAPRPYVAPPQAAAPAKPSTKLPKPPTLTCASVRCAVTLHALASGCTCCHATWHVPHSTALQSTTSARQCSLVGTTVTETLFSL